MSGWIQTWSGRRVYPLMMTVDDLNINDIAHSLSNLCRFNGHCERFYSVAEHCMVVASHVSQENALWGLMHDAAETYLCDLPSPVKALLPEYETAEQNILCRVAEKWGLPWPIPAEVDAIDRRAQTAEVRDLMMCTGKPWNIDAKPLPHRIPLGWPPDDTMLLFLASFSTYHNRVMQRGEGQ